MGFKPKGTDEAEPAGAEVSKTHDISIEWKYIQVLALTKLHKSSHAFLQFIIVYVEEQ